MQIGREAMRTTKVLKSREIWTSESLKSSASSLVLQILSTNLEVQRYEEL